MNPPLYTSPASSAVPMDSLRMYIRDMGQRNFPVIDLVFLQATGNYSWLHWRDGQRMLMPRTLKYYMPQLSEESFIRLHRNCIVNVHYIDHIERTDPDKGGLVYLKSGEVLPVSRRRWFAAKRVFSKYSLSN